MLSSRTRPPTGGGATNYGGARTYSKPFRSSLDCPLRSTLLDPTINNIPPSKTRSEYIRKIKKLGFPSETYDIDGDGQVSHEDYRIAKKFDSAGSGILNEEDLNRAKLSLIDDFVADHGDELKSFYSLNSSSPLPESSQSMTGVGASLFESTNTRRYYDPNPSTRDVSAAYEKMRAMQHTLKVASSWPIKECMSLVDDTLIKHNFYTDKYDQTAWNDFDAIPRSCSKYGLMDHCGSRKRLMFSRRQTDREHAASLMARARDRQPQPDTRRLKLISDMAAENS